MIATVLEQFCGSCQKQITDADRDSGCCRRCGAALPSAARDYAKAGRADFARAKGISRAEDEEGRRPLEPLVGDRKVSDRRRLSMREVEAFYRLDDQDIATTRRSWIPVFPEGTFDHPEYGKLVFDETTIPQYVRNFRNKVRHIEPCVDVDHKNEQAAGWIIDLQWRRGDGLFALVEWTTEGLGLVKGKVYRYTSAQFGDYLDEETGALYENVLSAVTLTNFPFLKQSPAIQLSSREKLMTLPGFVVNRQKGYASDDDVGMRRARRADDQDLDDDEGMQLLRCSNCSKALDDQDELDDQQGAVRCQRCGKWTSLSDDDTQLSDDQDLDDDQEVAYDSNDMRDEPQSQGFAPQSRQPQRSTGRSTTGVLPSRRDSAGGVRSAPGMSPANDPIDVDHRWQQMSSPPGARGMSPVRGGERYMTVTERRLADQIRYLGAQIDSLQEDPLKADRRLDEAVVREARQLCRERRWPWSDLKLKQRAMQDVLERRRPGIPVRLAEGGKARLNVHMARSRHHYLQVEPVIGLDDVAEAQQLAERRGLDWNDPAQKLAAFMADGR